MPEPIVIEIPDGETVEARSPEVEVRTGTAKGAFRIVPAFTPGRVRLETLKGVFLAWVNMEPDPVAAAVQVVRERCKAAVATTLAEHGQRQLGGAIFAAIDAPPEPVSKYERGQREMQARLIRKAELWCPKDDVRLSRCDFQNMVANFGDAVVYTRDPNAIDITEPTP